MGTWSLPSVLNSELETVEHDNYVSSPPVTPRGSGLLDQADAGHSVYKRVKLGCKFLQGEDEAVRDIIGRQTKPKEVAEYLQVYKEEVLVLVSSKVRWYRCRRESVEVVCWRQSFTIKSQEGLIRSTLKSKERSFNLVSKLVKVLRFEF